MRVAELVGAIGSALLLLGCASAVDPAEAEPEVAGEAGIPAAAVVEDDGGRGSSAGAVQAFKGYELYSREEEGRGWRFALVAGTNRLKTAPEIAAAAASEEEVRDQLAALPAGEVVTWCPPPALVIEPPPAHPPPAVVESLLALAAERRILLRLCDAPRAASRRSATTGAIGSTTALGCAAGSLVCGATPVGPPRLVAPRRPGRR
jgi:hypothetical protein